MIDTIRDKPLDNIGMSIDESVENDEICAMMLFTPDMGDTDEHFHISFDREQATALRNWFNKFLREPNLKGRFEGKKLGE